MKLEKFKITPIDTVSIEIHNRLRFAPSQIKETAAAIKTMGSDVARDRRAIERLTKLAGYVAGQLMKIAEGR